MVIHGLYMGVILTTYPSPGMILRTVFENSGKVGETSDLAETSAGQFLSYSNDSAPKCVFLATSKDDIKMKETWVPMEGIFP